MSRDSSGGSVMLAFMLGAMAGAAVALLFAPAAGEETREYLGKRAREGRDRAPRGRRPGPRVLPAPARQRDRRRSSAAARPSSRPARKDATRDRRLAGHHRDGGGGHGGDPGRRHRAGAAPGQARRPALDPDRAGNAAAGAEPERHHRRKRSAPCRWPPRRWNAPIGCSAIWRSRRNGPSRWRRRWSAGRPRRAWRWSRRPRRRISAFRELRETSRRRQASRAVIPDDDESLFIG